ncbi:MAG TPA: aspartyl/asparaginyl beta-hydroxylase domain-containing protein, partial [Bradyrhizobium sp.]
YHLGLVVPKTPGECRILIDGEPYSWREGEDLLFDETYLHTPRTPPATTASSCSAMSSGRCTPAP